MAIFALVDFIRLRIQLYLTVPRTERIRKAAGPQSLGRSDLTHKPPTGRE
jgi:hypothetical protein